MRRTLLALMAAALASGGGAAIAQDSNFYAGKTLRIVVGSSTGGYYDTAGRTVVRHFAKFIPGTPSIVVQNQPDSAGNIVGNRLANAMERDGTVIVVMSRALPQLALLGDQGAQFDPVKLTWLGSLSSYQDDAYLLTINATHPARKWTDATADKRALFLGGTRAGSTNITFALIARDMLKMHIDVVRGFPGANEIWLAMERGEVDGQMLDISAIMVGRPQLWAEKKLRPLVAFGRTERLKDFPDLPIARELVKDPADLELLTFAELPFFMALPFVAPPELPPERTKTLTASFMAMARDEAFRADMLKVGIMTSPIDGNAVRALVEKAAQTPIAVRRRFATLLSEK
jgi:tripartite-type tricarboxylate transporter receptor subunit TctC